VSAPTRSSADRAAPAAAELSPAVHRGVAGLGAARRVLRGEEAGRARPAFVMRATLRRGDVRPEKRPDGGVWCSRSRQVRAHRDAEQHHPYPASVRSMLPRAAVSSGGSDHAATASNGRAAPAKSRSVVGSASTLVWLSGELGEVSGWPSPESRTALRSRACCSRSSMARRQTSGRCWSTAGSSSGSVHWQA